MGQKSKLRTLVDYLHHILMDFQIKSVLDCNEELNFVI